MYFSAAWYFLTVLANEVYEFGCCLGIPAGIPSLALVGVGEWSLGRDPSAGEVWFEEGRLSNREDIRCL